MSFLGRRPLYPYQGPALDRLEGLQYHQTPGFFSFIACLPSANHDENKVPIIPFFNLPPYKQFLRKGSDF